MDLINSSEADPKMDFELLLSNSNHNISNSLLSVHIEEIKTYTDKLSMGILALVNLFTKINLP